MLVVGGGLTTDVAGFACATYRRSTNYIRVPTTLIGLIDASVSIKVAVNHGNSKNRLGAYHASQKVILDFSFLRTLPDRSGAQRDGRADQDLDRRQQRGSSNCWRSTARSCWTPASVTSTATEHCGRSPIEVTYDAINTMLTSRYRTCRSSTSTG